jgi:exodeoxyribonuclease III
MRVSSWNINSIRARLELVHRYLAEAKPDVLLLQETKAKDSDFPPETFASVGYHTARAGQPSYNGVAIISKYPLSNVRIGLRGDDEPLERRVISARVNPEAQRPFCVCSVYVPNGKSLDSPDYLAKLRFLDELKATLAQDLDLESSVVGGDFNIARDERDVFDPEAMAGQMHFTPQERQKLDQLMSLGLADTFRLKNDAPALFSWWDYRMQAFRRNRGLRIDYLFAGKAIVERLNAAQIDRGPRSWDKPSDHTPTLIDFDWS